MRNPTGGLAAVILALWGASVILAAPAAASDARALVENRSHPTQCAEFDNVYYTMTGADVRRFAIEVTPPVYLASLEKDDTAPNFDHCEAMKDDPKFKFQPKTLTLYEDADTKILGFTHEVSWRPRGAEVVIGGVDESDIHLIQALKKVDGKFVEYLVFYPFDGYWRAKPIPPVKFPEAAYGTSFLLGPIEEQHRPIVDVSKLEIDPKTLTFRMTFARGGVGELKVAKAEREGVTLEVKLDGLPAGDKLAPFAGIRSMFVTSDNADTARVNWRMEGGLFIEPVMDFKSASTTEVRFDRVEPSKHNTSAPDVTFKGFSDGK
ncbi:hypothetical protein [Methylopila sp. Yamaguchi]|uniref:hypothetical protein n=1 Tax=Methylopila sp. Yamaguchi TaxID=1437817 RepID=UPI000CAA65D6|nr:hypothetical protein [Methylopila sp. Yamaguchi]GBD47272.1 hypothetical protein METY_0485 [Methylopila sp. Yamaguchi]